MSVISAPAGPLGQVTVLTGPVAVPDLPDTPIPSIAARPRFGGELVQWVRVAAPGQLRAAFAGSRRVYDGIVPGTPGDDPATAALIQITPLPRSNSGLLSHLVGGTPLQYLWIDAADLANVTSMSDEIAVQPGDVIVNLTRSGWVGFVRQDRIWRDARSWVDDLDAAQTTAASGADATWVLFRNEIRTQVPATIKLLDHIGRPAVGGDFIVTDAAGSHPVTLISTSNGDTQIVVGAGGAQIAAQGGGATDPGVVVASATSDAGEVGGSLSLTATDRHVCTLRLEHWLAQRSAGVTGLHRWSLGNTLEPIVDGSPYFARLVPDLRSAENGGAVGLAGWSFVKDGLLDPTKPWSLLPEDNSTEVLALVDELITHDTQVRILVNQFLQITDADLQALQVDASVALILGLMLLMPASAFGPVWLDPIGWVLAPLGPAIVGMLPTATLRDLITRVAELSKATVEAINAAHPGTALWTPYPATLADNPLAQNPLEIAWIPITPLTHVGVYHQKIVVIRPAGADPVAYVGGIDIDSDRVDNPSHRAYAPFHDVQVRLTGPSVKDVLSTFTERAMTVGSDSPIAIPPADLPTTGRHIVQVGRTYFQPSGAAGHGVPFPSAPQGESTTRDTLLAAIGEARDYIYIEDQYFTPDDNYVDTLIAAAAPARNVKALVITVPDRADQPFGAERRGEIIAALQAVWQNRLRVGAPMRRAVNPTPNVFTGLGRMVLRAQMSIGDTDAVFGPSERMPATPFWAFVEGELVYVETLGATGTGPIGDPNPDSPDPVDQTWQHVSLTARGSLGGSSQWGAKAVNHHKGSPVLAVQVKCIYVHAKLMIIDDVFVSVGSSNLNRRGLEHDGEVNAFCVSQSLKRDPDNPALRLRCQLWAEHLGLPPEMGLSLLSDPLSAIQYFDRSWYRGSHWQPLQFAAAGSPTIVGFTAAGLLPTALQLVVGTIESVEKSTFWATAVDPTTGLDMSADPSSDRGPGL